MTATITHEVNNPLEAILNLTYLLASHPSLDKEANGYTRLLLGEVLRVSEITKQTLSFYRDPSVAREVDITEVLENVLSLHPP
jgi:signal transduction histidine kinase